MNYEINQKSRNLKKPNTKGKKASRKVQKRNSYSMSNFGKYIFRYVKHFFKRDKQEYQLKRMAKVADSEYRGNDIEMWIDKVKETNMNFAKAKEASQKRFLAENLPDRLVATGQRWEQKGTVSEYNNMVRKSYSELELFDKEKQLPLVISYLEGLRPQLRKALYDIGVIDWPLKDTMEFAEACELNVELSKKAVNGDDGPSLERIVEGNQDIK